MTCIRKAVCAAVACCCLTGTISAQSIAMKMSNVTVKQAMDELEKKSGYSFVFSSQDLDTQKRISVSADNDDVRTVIQQILDGQNVTYDIQGKNIVVRKITQQKAPTGKLKTITGTIIDPQGVPVIGANIVVKGTTNGTISDMDGKFTLEVPEDGVLQISYIGFENQTIRPTGGGNLTITLKEDSEALDEVVVIGYGTTSKRKTTAAITSVNAEDIASSPVPNVTQSLAGRAAGLIVTQSGGGVGSTASISIRGGGTPLYVIDDIISEARDFENLNPEDIEQITVLKDASATAVYGARAANGIIMVVTKQGKAGKMSVNYNFNYNFSQPSYLLDDHKLDSYNALYYKNVANINDGMAPTTSEEDLQKYKDGSDPYNYPNTDWVDILFRNFAPEQRHNLSLTAGSENIKVYSSLGYYDQESLYRTNAHNMKRYNFRTNAVMNFKEIGLKVTTGVDAYIWNMRQAATSGAIGWVHSNQPPMNLAYNQYGQIFSGTPDNPLLEISSESGYYKQERSTVKGNLALEWSLPWVEGLKLKALGNYTIVNDRNKLWAKYATAYDLEGNPNSPTNPNLSKNTYYHNNFTTQFFADYNRTFNEVHTIGATVGMEASGSNVDNNSLSRQNYLLNIDQINYGPVSTAQNSSTEATDYRRAAFIGRVKYDYAAKYMGEFSLRYDGSDYFPKGNRWGLFFSGSLAWMISEEDFWEPLRERHIFDTFKIRGSYGEIGLDGSTDGRLGRYEYVPSYTYSERGGYIGQQFVPGFSEGALVATDISWYTSKNSNVGIDFSSLDNKLSGTLEYFRMSTTGYLSSPSNVGYTDPLGTSLPKVMSNGESIRQGMEVWLQYKDNIGDLKYSVSGNVTFYDNRWNINPDESEVDLKNPYTRSTQVGSYWGNGYTVLGYYKDFEDIMNSPKRQSSVNLGAGDLKYYDFNGDGIIDSNDQHRIGTGSSPRMNYGITLDLDYKGWHFGMLWQGAGSYNIEMSSTLKGNDSNSTPIVYDFQTDFWTPDNTDSKFPRLHSSQGYNGSNNVASSDFWLLDAKYIRLKDLSLGYDFKYSVLKNVPWLTKCYLGFAGYNLLTFSPVKKYGLDPESGPVSYPISRTYSISLNVGF